MWYAGLLRPQLAVDDRMINGSVGAEVVVQLTMRNRGRFPVTVLSAGPAGPGLELRQVEPRRVEGGWPLTLQPGDRVELLYVYAVLDCGAVVRDAWLPSVVVARPWGPTRVTLLGTRNELTWPIIAAPRCGG